MTQRRIWIVLLLAWSLSPMLWQLISSFSSDEALISAGVSVQQRWTLQHYRELFLSDPPFWSYLFNSTVVATETTLLTLLLALPAAYTLARLPAGWRRASRLLITAAALFPYVLLFLALLEIARPFSSATISWPLLCPMQPCRCLWPCCC